METYSADMYRLFGGSNDKEDPCSGIDTEDINGGSSVRCNFCHSLLQFAEMSFNLTLTCGVLFGVFATFLWWVRLRMEGCTQAWDYTTDGIYRSQLLNHSVQAVIMFFSPLLTIAPISSWLMIEKSNVLFWCVIAWLFSVVDRFSLAIFHHYPLSWNSYVGNVIYCVTAFIVFYKFARYRQQQKENVENTIVLTLKLCMQLIFGMALALPYIHIFLPFYYHLSIRVYKMVAACSILAVLYIPKLIIAYVVTNLRGICKPNEGMIFAATFLVISAMLPRLAQARIEGDLILFSVISLFHGIFNVLEKVALPLRSKFFNCVCRSSTGIVDESQIYTQEYFAHQSLISIVTETSSIVWTNARLYLLFRRNGSYFTIKDLCMKLGIAVPIEWISNVLALKLQNDRYDIPVVRVWQRDWKIILVVHLIQIVLVVYFSYWVDMMLLSSLQHYSATICS